jgi:hypothetical protein
MVGMASKATTQNTKQTAEQASLPMRSNDHDRKYNRQKNTEKENRKGTQSERNVPGYKEIIQRVDHNY